MPFIHDLDLHHLPLESRELAADPTPFFAAAHCKHPWLATSTLGFVVTEYWAIDHLMRLDDTLKLPGEGIVDIMGARGTGWGAFAEDQMLAQSGERHERLRASAGSSFGPGSAKRLRPLMRETVAALLDEWTRRGTFDFTDFAANFPVRVMFSLVGASIEKLPGIIASLEIHGSSFNMEVEKMAIIEEAYQTLWAFVDGLIAERRRDGAREDLLDQLIGANDRGELSDTELRQMLILLFAAGYDTTKNLLTLLMYSMVQNPAVYKRCAEDEDYCRKVVKEQLRHTSSSNTYRIVEEPFTFRDIDFPKGTMLIFPLAVAGRDSGVFAEPLAFDPDRSERTPHIAFGRGMHMCLGQFIAQANVEEGIHLIAQRIANPRLAGEVTWRGFPGVWGIKNLPIEFDAIADA